MKSGIRWSAGLVSGIALWGGALVMARPAVAQGVGDVRIDLHPVRTQVGIVSGVTQNDAWIKLPNRVKEGTRVQFTAYSDGGDTLAVGTVRWAASVAPYEALVTDIHATRIKHDINPMDDYFTIGAVTKAQVAVGPRPFTDGNAADIAIGIFARAEVDKVALDSEAVEPVRANIQALRALKNKTAQAIADAAEKALVANPLTTEVDVSNDDAINYSLLWDNLRRFRRIPIADPITNRLLNRLLNLVNDYGNISAAVASDFLRPTQDTSGTTGILGGGSSNRRR